MEFKPVWSTSNSTWKIKTTISSMDYSEKTGLIAVGGAEGMILVFDPSAKILSSHTKGHNSNIMDLYFFD